MLHIKGSKNIEEMGKRAIQQVAIKEGVSVAEVRAEMKLAIQEAYDLKNPMWANSPFTDRMPTPEEFIVWTAGLTQQIK